MRRELDLIRRERKLFQQFACVAMAEGVVGGEVIGTIHEVCPGGGGFPRAADAALGVADDAVVHVDQAGAKQWRKRKDDGGGVAAGVGDESRCGNCFAV